MKRSRAPMPPCRPMAAQRVVEVPKEQARLAEAGDVADLVRLAREARVSIGVFRGGALLATRELGPFDEATWYAHLRASDTLVTVGLLDNAVVGYARTRLETLRDNSRLARVEEIYVESEARGLGVGEQLMDAITSWGAAMGCIGIDAIALPGDRNTKNFFETFGLVARAIVVHRKLDDHR